MAAAQHFWFEQDPVLVHIPQQELGLQQSGEAPMRHAIAHGHAPGNLGLTLLDSGHRALLRAVETLEEWSARSAQRRALFRLDDHVLHDVGLSRADVEREAEKSFWQK
jgi:uncharacterized protein YjiS (DUF1127 family)